MNDLMPILFSFRGRIQRLTFLIASIIQSALFYALGWVFMFFYSKLLFSLFLNSEALFRKIYGDEAVDKKLNVNMIRSEHNFIGYASLIPLLLFTLLPLWVTFALYIKRYRDIGISWIVTLILMILPYIFFGVMIYDPSIFINMKLPNFESYPLLTRYLGLAIFTFPFAYILLIYLVLPLLWPSKHQYRKEYNL